MLRIMTSLLLGVCVLVVHGQDTNGSQSVLDFRLSKVRSVGISLRYLSPETGRYTRAWGNREQNGQNHVLVEYVPTEGVSLENFIRDTAERLLIDMAFEHDIDVLGKQLKASVGLSYYDRRVSVAYEGTSPQALPVMWSASDGMLGSTEGLEDREGLLDQQVFSSPVFVREGIPLSFYAPLLDALVLHRTFDGEGGAVSNEIPFRHARYGFVSVSSFDLAEILEQAPLDTALIKSEYELVFNDGREERVLDNPEDINQLLTRWPPEPRLRGLIEDEVYTVLLEDGIPNAEYTFLWSEDGGSDWNVLEGVIADTAGVARVGNAPSDKWISVGNLLSFDGLHASSFESVLARDWLEVSDHRFAMLDLASRINAVPLLEDEAHVHPFYTKGMRDALCVLAREGLDAFAFMQSELAEIHTAFERSAVEYSCWQTLERNSVHEQLLVLLELPFPDVSVILSSTGGFSLATRKATILQMVSLGSDGLSGDEKRSIRRALSGEEGKRYEFTREEITQIIEVVNN